MIPQETSLYRGTLGMPSAEDMFVENCILWLKVNQCARFPIEYYDAIAPKLDRIGKRKWSLHRKKFKISKNEQLKLGLVWRTN